LQEALGATNLGHKYTNPAPPGGLLFR
jgi:hypothetical protein